MRKKITTNKMRNIIKSKVSGLKRDKALVKCEVCGKYIPLDSIQCHHSIITVEEVVKEFNEHHLSRTQAKSFLCSEENIMMVCDECHRKLHKEIS